MEGRRDRGDLRGRTNNGMGPSQSRTLGPRSNWRQVEANYPHFGLDRDPVYAWLPPGQKLELILETDWRLTHCARRAKKESG